jgi:FeS assembly SUF system regulator
MDARRIVFVMAPQRIDESLVLLDFWQTKIQFRSKGSDLAMKLSHLADYAVVLMTAAARSQSASGGGARLSATVLADDTGVPLPTTQKLMGQLAGAGLLDSHRGAGGGFSLSRPAADISLADIVEAVEGPIAMSACSSGGYDCALDAHCRVKPHLGVVGAKVRGALGAVSLVELAQ